MTLTSLLKCYAHYVASEYQDPKSEYNIKSKLSMSNSDWMSNSYNILFYKSKTLVYKQKGSLNNESIRYIKNREWIV